MAKLTDQALLTKVAIRRAFSSDMRRAAMAKLTDQALLAKVAAEAEDSDSFAFDVRLAAVARVTDQALLANLAVKAERYDVRRAAVLKLTDQALLARLASEDTDSNVWWAAVETLTDQTLLAELGAKAESLEVRIAALLKVTDQTLLGQLAEREVQAAIRQAAVRGITDDAALLQRLPQEPSAAVRAAIVATLRQPGSLQQVALSAYYEADRQLAWERLQQVSQAEARQPVSITSLLQFWKQRQVSPAEAAAAEVESGRTTLANEVVALAGENDGGRLLQLALLGEFDVLRAAAARRLSDPAQLEQVATQASGDRTVLAIVLAKLEDKPALSRVAESAKDPAMRLAATRRAGVKSWYEIFRGATARGTDAQALGDALAAVALFTDRQPDAVKGVQQACLNLIRLGNESRIPEMVDLLEGYGDKALAEDYLKRGQRRRLTPGELGTRWVSRHGVGWDRGRRAGARRRRRVRAVCRREGARMTCRTPTRVWQRMLFGSCVPLRVGMTGDEGFCR